MKAVKKESKQSTKKRTRFQKYDWLGGQVMAHLFCVKCIVSSDTDDLLSELGKSGKSHCNTCNCTISLFVYCVSWLQTGEAEWFACRSISILSRPLLKGSSRGSVLSFCKKLASFNFELLNYWILKHHGRLYLQPVRRFSKEEQGGAALTAVPNPFSFLRRLPNRFWVSHLWTFKL